jgi:alcohol dehydrogenase class IV
VSLNRELEVPSLKEFGVDGVHFSKNLQTMAEQAIASGSPSNNPRVPDTKDIVKLYKKLW